MIRVKLYLKCLAATVGIILTCSFMASNALAQATTAGTIINNEAIASFSIAGQPNTRAASASFTVQEIIDVTVTWVDSTNIFADTPEVDAVSQFEVANIGNGIEDFVLTVANSSAADQFDFVLPGTVEIFIDDSVNGTQGVFDIEDDLFITSTTIPPETAITVFVAADIPASLVQGDEGFLDLTSASNTAGAAGAATGTILTGLGDSGTDAIVGSTQATAVATAIYEISTVDVSLTKTVLSVTDTFGGNQFLPGATVVYRIELNVSGGPADTLVITDLIPADTTYVPGSIDLDGADMTDASGDDQADFNVTSANTVTVDLATVADGTTHTIDITVTIN